MNQKMKKTIATMCMGAAVLTLTPAVSWAETAVNPLNNQQGYVAPRMMYIDRATCDLTISGSTAKVECYVNGNPNSATKAKIIAELQVKSGSSWLPVKIWTVTENNFEAEVDESYSINATSTYRLKATVTVWEGSQSETKTLYSE